MSHLKRRRECRLCGSESLELVLPIRPSPVGDAFVPKERLDEKQDLYPLDCYLCSNCGHLQNLDVVDPEILFRDYTYRTSVSLGLVEHFRKYAESVVADLRVKPGSLVVEMGSNDGSLLRAFKTLGMRVVGVDPAREIAAQATASGVTTISDFFNSSVAKKIRSDHGAAELFCANNVFAHIDDLSEVVRGISVLLSDTGVFVFEVSYLVDMVDNMVFDTVYHEHVSYHLLLPLEKFLNRHDLTLFDVQRTNTKGGSIRAFAQRLSTGQRSRTPSLVHFMAEEERRGFLKPEIYSDWFEVIEERKREVLDYVDRAIAAGKTVVGYGASTTTTTLLYHFELESRLAFIVDDNPLKQGTYSPGAHIPVLPSSALRDRKADIAVILSWVYSPQIVSRNAAFVQGGGQFLIPLPRLSIVGA